MYKYCIARNMDRKFFILLFCIYAFYTGSGLNEAIYYNLTSLEFTLYAVTDHYYILYPFFLALIYMVVKDYQEQRSFVLIRCGSYMKYFITRYLALISVSAFLLAADTVISYMIGILSLEPGNAFISTGDNNVSFYGLQTLYKQIFSNPFEAIILTQLYTFMGFAFICIVFMYLLTVLQKGVGLCLIFLCYLSSCIALSWRVDGNMPYLFLNNYISFHHGIEKACPMLIFLIEITAIAFVLFAIGKRWGIREA